ncbi:hypothetical protein DFS33DRAFT_1387001 [Desarmillaria ectypa]|nr:hypothetical protein DFS33DRAFT_1387001 [Desarmillaria ectypa]
MLDVSPLASDIINKTPDLLHKLNRYLDQNGKFIVQCENLEAEIALVTARLETQRQIRERMNSVKKPELDFTREENPLEKNQEDIEQTQTNKGEHRFINPSGYPDFNYSPKNDKFDHWKTGYRRSAYYLLSLGWPLNFDPIIRIKGTAPYSSRRRQNSGGVSQHDLNEVFALPSNDSMVLFDSYGSPGASFIDLASIFLVFTVRSSQ